MARIHSANPSINIISAGTTVKGDIKSNGDFRIDGILMGSIYSKGKVIVGSTGKIDGELVCQSADISGEVKAQINITDMLFMKSPAKINGDIMTGKLAIEAGAKFTGYCTMESVGTKVETTVPQNEKAKVKEQVL